MDDEDALLMEVDDAVNPVAATKALNRVHPFAFVTGEGENVKLRIAERSLEEKVASACLMQHSYKTTRMKINN